LKKAHMDTLISNINPTKKINWEVREWCIL
jgi:hypothetical protein